MTKRGFDKPKYGGGRKKNHLPAGVVALEVRCLQNGQLDVCLESGVVRGRNGNRIAVREDRHGYLSFGLNREKKPRRGKAVRDRGRKRWRERRTVFVHRLVKIKALAVAIGGDRWRDYVRDLPRGIDVNHIDTNRRNNRATNLELQTELVNRLRREADERGRTEVYSACTEF